MPTTGSPSATLVVPCYNEERRLPKAAFARYLADEATSGVHVLFVDDGSRDQTLPLLRRIAAAAPPGRAGVLALGSNCGKAEAVRRGMVHALGKRESELVGFWDADLATPLCAVQQLASVLASRSSVQMVFGARVALLGRRITRHPVRHYLGRVFATLASFTLDLPIYDTQCGAKLFRSSPALRAVVGTPFLTRWVFDCEMIARYGALGAAGGHRCTLAEAIVEFPLEEWVDVAGSKVRKLDVLRMALGLLRIRIVYFLHEWPSGRRRPALYSFAAGALCLLLVGALAALFVLHELTRAWRLLAAAR